MIAYIPQASQVGTKRVHRWSEFRGCYVGGKIIHSTKDFPHHVFRVTPILAMKGRCYPRRMRGRGSGSCSGSCRDTLTKNGCIHSYSIPSRQRKRPPMLL